MEFASICYNNSFLNQVIIRTDFLEFIPTDKLFNDKIILPVLKHFPKKGKPQMIKFQNVNFVIDENSATTNTDISNGIQQEFSNINNNKVILSNKYLILEINQYTSYERTSTVFSEILSSLFSVMPLTSSRTGIRYINIYEDGQLRLSKDLFNNQIGPSVNRKLSAKENDLICIRNMTLKEYRIKEKVLNFRYGMFNPEYPNAMKHAAFVLDYDCYTEDSLVGFESIMSHIKEGHGAIQYLFEDSITDKLRKIMKDE